MSEPKYKLVPVEPTSAMLRELGFSPINERRAMYLAMLAAATSPPQDPRDEALRVAREALEYYAVLCVIKPEFGAPANEALRQIKELMGEK